MQKIRILIVDDHAILRSGLRLLIAGQADMEVAGEAGDFDSAIRLASTLAPDVITLDLSMPGGTGLAAIEKIRAAAPGSRICVLTMHDDPAYLRSALAMGATGYMVKSGADTELISAIRAVHKGRVFVDVQNARTMEHAIENPQAESGPAPISTLSGREREVLVLVAQGHTNQAVANQLGLSVKTVESYRARLLQKLGMTSRAELTKLVMEAGLLKT